MDTNLIKTLVGILEGSTLNVLDVGESDFHLRLEKNNTVVKTVSTNNVVQETVPSVEVNNNIEIDNAPIIEGELPKGETTSWEEYKEIKSPLVGVFKSLKNADKGEDIEIGQQIKKGEVVCVLEAMKLMNEIKSDFSGEVVQVLVNDGDAVEYGQVLFRIKED